MRYTLFPLHPDTPESGISLDELFLGRFDIAAMMKHLQQVAAELGLPFGDRTHTYNSRRAQELGKWAEVQGLGEAFHDAIYRAYFVDGLNIANIDVLSVIASSLGLDGAMAAQVLAEQRYAAAVDADWRRAQALGVSAVPSIVYGNRRLVGFRPYEEYRTLVSAAG